MADEVASIAPLRAAVVQAGSVPFDLERSLEKALDLTADAARAGAKLIVFPEAYLSGYPKESSFGALVGLRSSEGRELYRRYADSAVDVPGPVVDKLARAATAAQAHVVVGVIERDGGTLYCTALFFSPNGQYLGKHRKLMPTASERLIWGFGDGSMLSVFETDIGRLGAVICWENYMPMLRMTMYGKGVQLYCVPTVDDRDSWIPTMRHIAVEGRCFVLSACQFMRRGDYGSLYPTSLGDEPDRVVIRGGSCIIDPFGQLLAGPCYEGETILTAELDLSDIVKGKYDLDVVGHYARPDVFRLTVDERAKPAVTREVELP